MGYIALWVASHLLVYSSRRSGAPEYNTTSLVLLTEVVKLLLACGLYVAYDGTAAQLVRAASGALPLAARYSGPDLLFCAYNNLMYVNLAAFDPGTYRVLMQLRIVMTGLLYQLLFARRLNRNQWLAILLTASGCMVQESAKLAGGAAALGASAAAGLLLVAQMAAGALAGVLNELLLKGKSGGAEAPAVNLQNAFMARQLDRVERAAAALPGEARRGGLPSAANLASVCRLCETFFLDYFRRHIHKLSTHGK